MPITSRSGSPGFGRTAAQRLIAVSGGLIAVGALAGCSATTDDAVANDASTAPSTSSAPAPAASTATGSSASGGYRDGTYTADGPYVSPGGNVAVGVSITLKSGAITAVTVTPEASDPTSRQYESQFASGIAAVVVGKPLKGLSVGAVSGSSLTGTGFDKALDAIRTKAAA